MLAISTVASGLGAAPATAAEAASPSIDAFIEQRMEEAGIVGLGAAIVVDRRVVWTKGYGFADAQRGVPFTPRTVMNVGSISKTITGVAMMRAVEEGRLDLDEDIGRWLPFRVANPHRPGEKITLRHLATHTSGITDRWSVYEDVYRWGGAAPQPLGEFLASYFVPGGRHWSKDNFLDVKPGTQREYSNIAAALAGHVVEVATGETLDAYTRKRVFEPLGMADTAWRLADVGAKHSTLYAAQDGMAMPLQPYELTTYPDGGLRTSVADLSRLFIALLGDGAYEGAFILDPRSVAEMLRFQFTEANKPENVVLKEINSGLFWATKLDVTRIGYNGSDPGARTEMLSNLSKDLGVILFSNTSLAGEDGRKLFEISRELWKHGESLRR